MRPRIAIIIASFMGAIGFLSFNFVACQKVNQQFDLLDGESQNGLSSNSPDPSGLPVVPEPTGDPAMALRFTGSAVSVFAETGRRMFVRDVGADDLGNTYTMYYSNTDAEYFDSKSYLEKVSKEGVVVWSKALNASIAGFNPATFVVNSSGIYIVGYSLLASPHQPVSYVQKFSFDGDLVWNQTVPSLSAEQRAVRVFSVAVNPANQEVYVAGYANAIVEPGLPELNTYRGYIAKFNSSGSRIWIQQMEQQSTMTGLSIDSMGNAYVLGFCKCGENSASMEYFAKVNSSNGEFAWMKKSTVAFGSSTRVLNDSPVLNLSTNIDPVTGASFGKDGNGIDIKKSYLMYYKPNGDLLKAIATTKDGLESPGVYWNDSGETYLIGSTKQDLSTGVSGNVSHLTVFKYNASGAKIWTKQVLGKEGLNIGLSAIKVSGLGLHLAGSGNFDDFNKKTISAGETDSKAFLLRFNADGNP